MKTNQNYVNLALKIIAYIGISGVLAIFGILFLIGGEDYLHIDEKWCVISGSILLGVSLLWAILETINHIIISKKAIVPKIDTDSELIKIVD